MAEDINIKHEDIYDIALHHRFQWEEAQNSFVILFPEGMVKLHGGAGEVIEADIIGMFEMAFGKAWIRKLN